MVAVTNDVYYIPVYTRIYWLKDNSPLDLSGDWSDWLKLSTYWLYIVTLTSSGEPVLLKYREKKIIQKPENLAKLPLISSTPIMEMLKFVRNQHFSFQNGIIPYR